MINESSGAAMKDSFAVRRAALPHEKHALRVRKAAELL